MVSWHIAFGSVAKQYVMVHDRATTHVMARHRETERDREKPASHHPFQGHTSGDVGPSSSPTS
jgi:hypothetical protein